MHENHYLFSDIICVLQGFAWIEAVLKKGKKEKYELLVHHWQHKHKSLFMRFPVAFHSDQFDDEL